VSDSKADDVTREKVLGLFKDSNLQSQAEKVEMFGQMIFLG
jgi:hypothetical protein